MFERPSLETLIERTRADVLTRQSTDDVLRHSDAEVLARVQAGAVHGLYGYLDWLSKQLLPDTATDWIERHGSLWGIARKPATKATGSVQVSCTMGVVIPQGTLFQSAAKVQVETAEEVTTTATSMLLAVSAVVAGDSGNLAPSTPLSLVNPIAGVQTAATVVDVSGGADQESVESYRSRILTRIRKTPQGGAAHDYIAWALEVPGVTRAWAYPEELGAGTVTVRFVRDNDASIIPDDSEVATVQAYIDALRPVTARVVVVAPVAVPITFQIEGVVPSTSELRTQIESSLRSLLLRESEPGEPVLISHIREAISATSDEYDHALVSPTTNVTHGTGEMATFGEITWL